MIRNTAQAIPPVRFRNQATGISPCIEEREEQGAARAARVVSCMPPATKRAIAPAQGYDLSAKAPADPEEQDE